MKTKQNNVATVFGCALECDILCASEHGTGSPALSTHAVRLHRGADDAGLDL